MTFSSIRIILLVLTTFSVTNVWAQGADELRHTILDLDRRAFAAFNSRDAAGMAAFISRDLEFYHDQDGLSGYDQFVENSHRLFSSPSPLRRRLIEEAFEVHPVPGYGAIQIGKHEFCHEENGVDVCGIFDFLHLWRYNGESWVITKVFSYGH